MDKVMGFVPNDDSPENTVVYGVNCVWWDTMDKLPQIPGIPKCPHCGSVLLMESKENWDKAVAVHNVGNPGYKQKIEWGRGKCFRDWGELSDAYRSRARA